MVSAAEQLAANLNFGAFAKAEELKKRIWFTLAALVVYRLGTYIPIPGINPAAFAESFKAQSSGILGMFNMFAGGAVERMAIFALNIMPYISASIIMQLMTSVVPTLEALKKEGEQGRKQINQYTRYMTVALAAFQAYGIAFGLEGSRGASGPVVIDPGWFFRISTVVTLVGGTMFLMWLGEQITARGVGNGTSLIIMSGIVAGLPSALAGLLELSRQGRHLLAAPDRSVRADAGGGGGHRLHRARPAPPARAVSQAADGQPHVPGRCLAPAPEAQLLGRHSADLRLFAAAAADHGGAVQRRLRARSGSAPLSPRWGAASRSIWPSTWASSCSSPSSTRPSSSTRRRRPTTCASTAASYRASGPAPRRPSTSTTCSPASPSSAPSTSSLVCVLPELLIAYAAVPFYFGGTSLLIAVSVTMDTVAQVQGHLLAHQYEGLIKKAKLRGATRR